MTHLKNLAATATIAAAMMGAIALLLIVFYACSLHPAVTVIELFLVLWLIVHASTSGSDSEDPETL